LEQPLTWNAGFRNTMVYYQEELVPLAEGLDSGTVFVTYPDLQISIQHSALNGTGSTTQRR
jgi:hypothetical protein